jgi:hypothetical protein
MAVFTKFVTAQNAHDLKAISELLQVDLYVPCEPSSLIIEMAPDYAHDEDAAGIWRAIIDALSWN